MEVSNKNKLKNMKYGGEQACPLPLLSIIQINIAFTGMKILRLSVGFRDF